MGPIEWSSVENGGTQLSSAAHPTVTVVITARNRPDELARTLRELRTQDYPAFSVLVIDDASQPSLHAVVAREWPGALFWRNEVCHGLIANRSRAMAHVTTAYLVSLDDDSCFTRSSDLSSAIRKIESNPAVAALTFFIYQGPDPVPTTLARPAERYVSSFIGCGHLLRVAAIRKIGGYRDSYFYYGEEAEYSLRLWNAGWRVLLLPDVLVHHRISAIGRSNANILAQSVRNNLWTLILHMPARRLVMQGCWRLFSAFFESVRVGLPGAFFLGLARCLWGIRRVLMDRDPIHVETLRKLDIIQMVPITDESQWQSASHPGLLAMAAGFLRRWRDRPRARAFWDKRPGVLGAAEGAAFPTESSKR